MNNILTFEDYKKMNIRQVESVIYRQFIDEDIKDKVNEGFIRNAINKLYANSFIKKALAEEIEKGKELEIRIKEALDSLNKGFEEIENSINREGENNLDSESKLTTIENVKEAIKSAQSQAFDTLTMIGSEGEIDFSGFMASSAVAALANFGILFSPIRSLFMTRKAYKYFIGIIKQTIRRNLLIIQLNFDQFENLILQKSFETEDDSETITKNNTLHEIIGAMQKELIGKDSKMKMFTGKKGKEMRNYLDVFKKTQEALYKDRKERDRHNPLSSLWADQHNNTYTRTLEQIKQYINDDSQKELDSLKNSITKISGKDEELAIYGELLISAAEEYAVTTNHGINNNFIKMSSVFNLDNQKKLIDLIVAAQKENEDEIVRQANKQKIEEEIEKNKTRIKEGKKLYKEKLNTSEKYTLDKFEKDFSDGDIISLKAFFQTNEGKDEFEKLVKENPLYKYFIIDDVTLNTLLTAINDLEVVEISNKNEFYENISQKEQALYYIMAEKSIKDAVKSNVSEEYFGVQHIEVDETTPNIIEKEIIEKNGSQLNKILNSAIGLNSKNKTEKKYYLTFKGAGDNLFNILHKDFKTSIFKDDGEYESEISIESKKDLMKLIHKNIKFGNSISTTFAEYLVRLEAHMLLKNQETPWFVVKNNDEIKEYFDPDSSKLLNKHAFVEISPKDYENIKTFLSKYHILSDKDFDVDIKEKEVSKKE